MWRRILAVLIARNREFYRDRAGLGWNILMPVLMVLGFAFVFSGDPSDELKIAVIGELGAPPAEAGGLLGLRHVQLIAVSQLDSAIRKVERHQVDLLVDLRRHPIAYWVSTESAKGYLAERLVLGAALEGRAEAAGAGRDMPERHAVSGTAVRYADWVLPGILAMNLMFSSLWGVGWVIVRYRKNGVLRRLKATPLTPFEFLTAQVLSRMIVVLGSNLVVYLGLAWLLHFPMRGSYVALVLVYTAGALCMISLGLIVSSRLRTEELADGILNLISWPMLLLSGVWFSMEGTSLGAQVLSRLSPLSHVVDAARRIMIDGADLVAVVPDVLLLFGLAVAFLAVAARLFRWE